MNYRAKKSVRQLALTLVEAICIFAVFVVLAAVLFPVFARPREHGGPSEMSDIKQIGLGILQYTEDYDGIYPPPRAIGIAQSECSFPGETWENTVMPYIKSIYVFHCPDVSTNDRTTPSYRYSDLAADAKITNFAAPSYTVLLMDGDLTTDDVGHAWTPTSPPLPAQFTSHGKCIPGLSATVEKAPLRHKGGALYLFADNHVKYLHPDSVFFPPRASVSRSHKDADGIAIGPDPAGDMTFARKTYSATFHLR